VDQVDPPDAVADQEQGVADDRAAQRDRQHDQCGRGLVPEQGGEDGAQFHGGVLGGAVGRTCVSDGGESRRLWHVGVVGGVGGVAPTYWLLSWMAGVTCIACHAGMMPASRLAPTASTKVVSSISGSRCASSA